MLANLLKNHWNTIFWTEPTLHLNKIRWDRWVDSRSSITIRFRELETGVFSDDDYSDKTIIADPFGTTTHFRAAVDIHIFVRHSSMTLQDNVITHETDVMLRYLDDWIDKNPTILKDEGISRIFIENAQSSVLFDDKAVTHSIITVKMYCTKIYR